MAGQEEEAKARQRRRNTASIEYAGNGAGIGTVLGAIVIGLAGCNSCINYSDAHPFGSIGDRFWGTGFNLITGALIGAIGGALIGAILGALIGQGQE